MEYWRTEPGEKSQAKKLDMVAANSTEKKKKIKLGDRLIDYH